MPQEPQFPQGQGLDMGEKGKEEALFQELFNEAQEAISRVYLPGTMAHIREHQGELFNFILLTERKLNELWLAMREGEPTLGQFKGTLRLWQDYHLKAIELYRKQREQKEAGQGNLF